MAIGAVIGALASGAVCVVDYRQGLRYDDAKEARIAKLEIELESYPEERLVLDRLESLGQVRTRALAIIEDNAERRVDPAAFDEAVVSAAATSGVRLEQIEWAPDGLFITFRVNDATQMVLFAEQIEDHPSIGSVEIWRWRSEESPDRFVVKGRWVGREEGQ